MRGALSLPLVKGPLRPGVVEPFRIPSMNQVELFNLLTVYKQITDVILNCEGYNAMLEPI